MQSAAISAAHLQQSKQKHTPRPSVHLSRRISRFSTNQLQWNNFRRKVYKIVNNQYVQQLILLLIITNSITMGIGTFDFVTENEEIQQLFEIIDKGFLIIFTIELVFQFVAEGFKFFVDGWLILDFIVVMISWASDLTNGANLQVIRAFRIFRALRLVTRVKMMRDLVTALLSTLPDMSAVIFLMSILLYIFAVMFTSLYKNLSEDENIDESVRHSFSSLTVSLFTLIQLMTMDGWSNVCREIMIAEPLAWIPIITFLIMSAFVGMNLVIAIICGAVNQLDEDEDNDDDKMSDYDSKLAKQIDMIQAEMDNLKKKHESIHEMTEFIRIGLLK